MEVTYGFVALGEHVCRYSECRELVATNPAEAITKIKEEAIYGRGRE